MAGMGGPHRLSIAMRYSEFLSPSDAVRCEPIHRLRQTSKDDQLTCLSVQKRNRANYLKSSIAAFYFSKTSSNNSRSLLRE